jgi:hypothetical protein
MSGELKPVRPVLFVTAVAEKSRLAEFLKIAILAT